MKTVFTALLTFCQFTIQAQTFIQGSLVDKETTEPIPYAHISILGTNQGILSNENGMFILKNIADKKAKIKVSSIGYETDTIQWDFAKDHDEFLIELNPSIVQLESVYVNGKKATAEEIIEEAFLRISDNYWLDEHLLTGYFKESENTNEKPIYLAEAIIQAVIPGKGSDADERIKIIHLADRKKEMEGYEEWKIDLGKRLGIPGGAYRCLKNSINDLIDPIEVGI